MTSETDRAANRRGRRAQDPDEIRRLQAQMADEAAEAVEGIADGIARAVGAGAVSLGLRAATPIANATRGLGDAIRDGLRGFLDPAEDVDPEEGEGARSERRTGDGAKPVPVRVRRR